MKKLRVGVEWQVETGEMLYLTMDHIHYASRSQKFENKRILITEEISIHGAVTFTNCTITFKEEGQLCLIDGKLDFIECEIFNHNQQAYSIVTPNRVVINFFNTIVTKLETLVNHHHIKMNFFDSLIFHQRISNTHMHSIWLYNSHIVTCSKFKEEDIAADLFEYIQCDQIKIDESRIETVHLAGKLVVEYYKQMLETSMARNLLSDLKVIGQGDSREVIEIKQLKLRTAV